MPGFLESAEDALRKFEPASFLDITIIAALIYVALLLLRRTTAMAVLRGAIIVAAGVLILARVLDLTVLDWLLRNLGPALLLVIAVVFQPEIRRALERVGRTGRWASLGRAEYEAAVEAVAAASEDLARKGHGAIVVLERETGLEDYIDTGIRLDGSLSEELLKGIFFPNSPLHDGAVILRGDRVAAARCTLPLSQGAEHGLLGTRHRAALGISEVTDAVVVVVSEETGNIAVAAGGRMISQVDGAGLRALLMSLYAASARMELGPRRRVRV